MKIEVKDVGEFEVKDISYSQARQLHRMNAKVFWQGAVDDKADVNPDEYYDLLEKTREMSGLKDKDLKKYTMVQVDVILQQVLMQYTGLNPKD